MTKAVSANKRSRGEEKLSRTGLEELVSAAFSGLSDRHRRVLEKRFGLNSREKATLAKLGKSYGITRERIRQIEAFALRAAAENLREKKKLADIIRRYLENLGGLRREDLFLRDIRFLLGIEDDVDVLANRLKFFAEVYGEPFYHPENGRFHGFWFLHDNHKQTARRFIEKLAEVISKRKEEVVEGGRFHEFFAKVAALHRLVDLIALNYLSVSKKFHINPYGDIGLAHWPEIKPRRMGEKARLVLKKASRPLHFKEIAEAINAVVFDRRVAYPQTVHNELIRDPNFVLVGRGLYGLKEHGFVPGTAADTVKRILKERGPLKSSRVVDLVSREKFFKPNTVLLNLQNKKLFKKLPDGRFTLVKK